MKVILNSDVKGQGKKGTLVEVSDGYGRNYLLPRGLAIEANNANLNVMKTKDAAKKHDLEVALSKAQELGRELSEKTVRVTAKGGENGKLFGSVTTKEICEELSRQFSITLDKKKVTCEDIKAFGTYTAEARIHTDVTAKFFVMVTE